MIADEWDPVYRWKAWPRQETRHLRHGHERSREVRHVSTGADKWWLKKCMEVLTFFYFLDEIGGKIIS